MEKKEVRAIPLGSPVFDEEMGEAALNALRHERFVLGEDVLKFEEEFAEYMGAKFAVSMSSGTNALQIALLALGLSKGDKVITSAFSFVASANSIFHASGFPVFSDIAEDFNIDPAKIKLKITRQTKFLLPVHLYGYPCKMKEIVSLAGDNDLMVVEDACQAHGAIYDHRKVGTIGDAGCFSFYPSKNMTVCGDGGMMITDNSEVAKLAAKLRDCGRKSKYEHDVIGYTSRLNTVNAAVGRVQLKRLSEWNKKRRHIASIYNKMLSDLDEVITPPQPCSGVEPVYHCYVIRAKKRDDLKLWLQTNGVQSGVHYPLPIPLQPIYKNLYGYKSGDYPVSEDAAAKCLSLPIYPGLSDETAEHICGLIHDFLKVQKN
jgi:perosamine synthetase